MFSCGDEFVYIYLSLYRTAVISSKAKSKTHSMLDPQHLRIIKFLPIHIKQ